ncbi:PhnD/SsuA/transferrin family substrate-binding protein, partial [Geoalkalibacter sp.]|uniref:PhnD/SsuA/transferrin family substrate-binding protein n=1 Tax=Geoalkalibacter sp. TaxID=3041440 RepID=UPI00272E0ED7
MKPAFLPIFLAFWLLPAWTAQAGQSLTLGVLAFRPAAQVEERWQPLLDYLQGQLPEVEVRLQVFGYEGLEEAVQRGQVDLVLTNPAHYVLIANREGLSSPLASQINLVEGVPVKGFGGVILVRADDHRLRGLADLKGKRLASPALGSLGGYQMQARELARAGLRIPQDIQILETGMPHDRAVEALLDGRADAALVRSGLYEDMLKEGRLPPGKVRILNVQSLPGFPHGLSTPLYPEWPMAALPQVDDALAARVASALLALPHGGEIAASLGIHGFTVPYNYEPVRDLLETLRLPPFDAPPKFTWSDIRAKHGTLLILLGLVSASGCLLLVALIINRRHIKAAQAALRASEENYRDLFRNMIVGFAEHEILLDETGQPRDYRFLQVNPAFESLTGLKAEAILGRRVLEVLPDTEPFWIQTYGRVALGGEPLRFENFSGALGKHFEVSVYAPQPGRFATIFLDISERKRQEAELLQAKAAAEAASLAKSRFLATMSHEIRTPLNGILGMAQLLEMSELSAKERQEAACTILDSGKILLALLNDVLDLSKIEAGKLELVEEIFSPQALLDESLSLFAAAAQEQGLALEAQWLGGDQERFLGDPLRLRQMLSNLISNALKFTEQGGIRVQARPLAEEDGQTRLLFSVTDTGMGVPTEQQGLLFKPFSQADSSDTRKFGGTGLGLSIVRTLAQLMGGETGVESRPGQGATFWFSVRAPTAPSVRLHAATTPGVDARQPPATAARL